MLDENTWNHLTVQKNVLKLIKNVINKMCLQIIFDICINRISH